MSININPIYSNYHIKTPMFRAKEDFSNTTIPIEKNINLKGCDALAAYNYATINKNKNFNIPAIMPIEIPDDLSKIDGEKIYNSNGDLICVSKNIDGYKYVYHNNQDKLIEIFNNENGIKIKSQETYTSINNEAMISVVLNADKKTTYQSFYEDCNGELKLDSKSKNITMPDGSTKEFIYNVRENEYQTIEHSNYKDTNWLFDKSIIYDANKNIKSITEHDSNSWSEKEVLYKNGTPYSIEEEKVTSVPNNLNREPLQDIDLQPAQKYNKKENLANLANLEGAKTYYSNGVVEQNITDDAIYSFNYKGELEKVETENKVINFNKYNQEIIEKLKDGSTRTTNYFTDEDGTNESINVLFVKDKTHKALQLLNSKLTSYSESKDGSGWCADYDKNGNLMRISESCFEGYY